MTTPRDLRVAFRSGFGLGLLVGAVVAALSLCSGCTAPPPEPAALGDECTVDQDCAPGLHCEGLGNDGGKARYHLCTQPCNAVALSVAPCGDNGGCMLYTTPVGTEAVCLALCEADGSCAYGDPHVYAGTCLCWPSPEVPQ